MEWYLSHRRPILLGLLAAAIGVLVALPWLVVWLPPLQPKASFWISLVGLNLLYLMLVMSLNLVMGYAGLLSLIQTGLMAVGGYTSGVLVVNFGWSFWVSLVAAVMLSVLFAIVVMLVSVRATYLYFGMITFAFNLFIVELAREWDSVTGGFYGLVNIPPPTIGGRPLSPQQVYLLIVVAMILTYLLVRNLVTARAGRAFQAVRESPETATSLGIPVVRTRLLAFALGGAIAGLVGVLFAHQQSFMEPSVGLLDNALFLFVALMLGGVGTLMGPALGMGVLAVIDRLIVDLSQYRRLILGSILLLALMAVPRGIVGTFRASRYGAPRDEDLVVVEPAEAPEPAEAALAVPSDGEPSVVLRARGVSKSYGGVRALRAVDLEVRRGEIRGIIGPNGSGKSTFVNCLTGFLTPDEGEIELFGEPKPRRAHQIAEMGVTRVFQVPHLFERVSVLDNVLTGMHMRSAQSWPAAALRLPSFRRDESGLRLRGLQLLDIAGLRRVAGRNASSLSHGQKRLLEMVRAVAAGPKVLILDEPATGLTSEEVEASAGLIRRLRDAGLTVILIEHNMAFVMSLCDRVTVLDSGRVIADGSPAEVQASPAVQIAYLGVPVLAGETP